MNLMMRGIKGKIDAMFVYLSPEALVSPDHPLRRIRKMVDQARAELTMGFDRMYSHKNRPSIPPEKLLF